MPAFVLSIALGWALIGVVPAGAAVDFEELARTASVERVRQSMDYFAGLGA